MCKKNFKGKVLSPPPSDDINDEIIIDDDIKDENIKPRKRSKNAREGAGWKVGTMWPARRIVAKLKSCAPEGKRKRGSEGWRHKHERNARCACHAGSHARRWRPSKGCSTFSVGARASARRRCHSTLPSPITTALRAAVWVTPDARRVYQRL